MGCCQTQGGVDTHGNVFSEESASSNEARAHLELPTSEKRVVFVSLTSLNVFFRRLPAHVWDECLVCVNAHRDAVRLRLTKGGKALFDCQWLAAVSDELLHEVMQKDERGLVLWLNPSLTPTVSWKQVSAQLQKIPVKPGSEQLLASLQLDDKQFWKTRLTPAIVFENDCEWVSDDYENDESRSDVGSFFDELMPNSPIPTVDSAAFADTKSPSQTVDTTDASRSVSSRYGVTSTQVFTQFLVANSLNYGIACEILYQSNPRYLIPMQNLDRKLYNTLAAEC